MNDIAMSMPDQELEQAPAATVPSTAQLVVKRNGQETEEVFTVTAPATIGRFDPSVGPIDVDLANLPEGAYVSRKHAVLKIEDGLWVLADLGSSNGTFLLRDDFERIESAPLENGSEFALGNARFIIHWADEAGEPEAAASPDGEADFGDSEAGEL